LRTKRIYLNSGSAVTILPRMWANIFGRKKTILAATYIRSASKNKNDLAVLMRLIEDRKNRTDIDRYYPLEKTAYAHRYVETGRKIGNVEITIEHKDTSSESELKFTVPRPILDLVVSH